MATLGIHTFAVAPQWDSAKMRAIHPRLAAHGVRAIEIPLIDPDEIDQRAARAVFDETGARPVCSLGLPGSLAPITDPDPALAFLDRVFAVAEGLGTRLVTGVTYGTIGRTSGAPVTEAERDGMCRFLDRAAAMAHGRGLQLGIEPCNRYETHLLNTGAQARAICEAVGAENMVIHIDTYHMNIEERSMAQGLRDCGPFLGYVHLSESHRGTPGQGTIDWDDVFAGLAEVGFDGIAALESMNHVHPGIAAGLAIWRPVADDPEQVIEAGLPFLQRAAARAGVTFD